MSQSGANHEDENSIAVELEPIMTESKSGSGPDLNAAVSPIEIVNIPKSPISSPRARSKFENSNNDENNKNNKLPVNANGSSNEIGDITFNNIDTPIPDVNIYQQKKTLAQGMMDLALLSANANQLRYVLESSERHPYYYTSIFFISLSITLQIAVGIGLILNSRYNVKNGNDMCMANKINNFTVIAIFSVTVVNVFVSVFGVSNPPPNSPQM